MTAVLLEKARSIAGRTGETNHLGTAFGPVNVAIHAIGASLQLGDGRAAAEAGEALDLTAIPSALVGKRTQASLDLARAYTMRKQDAAAVNLLLAAERLSPELVRYDRRTRDVLTELCGRTPSAPRRNCGRSPAGRECSNPSIFVRVTGPHPGAGFLPSRRYGSCPETLPSLGRCVHSRSGRREGADGPGG